MWGFLVGWLILIPLLYFATNGNILPASSEDVSLRVAAPGGSSLLHRLGVGVVSVLCSMLILSRLPAVCAAAQRMKLILALPLLAILSSVWSQEPRQTMVSGSILLLFTLFAFYLGFTFSPRQQFELLMLAGGVALTLSVLLIIVMPGFGASDSGWRGIFGHKQNCAAAATFLLVTALHWKPSGLVQRLLAFSCSAMCCVFIVMSHSRTGWVLAVIALCLSACLWGLQKMSSREAIVALMSGAAVGGGIAYTIYRNAAQLLPVIGRDATLDQRTIIWSAAWATIAKQPITGYGYGAFWNGLQGASLNMVLLSGWALQQSQNGFLDLWLQAGVGCVVLIALMTGQAMWNGTRCFRGSGEDSFVRWCIVIVVCTLLYNIGESSLGMIHLVWFLFLLAVIGLQQTAQSRRAESLREEKSPARASRPLVPVIAEQ